MERQNSEAMVETEALAINPIIAFVSGLLIGGVATYFATRKRIKENANKEIEEVRMVFSNIKKKEEKPVEKQEEAPKVELEKPIKVKPHEPSDDVPFVIPLETFVEDDDYEKDILIFYEEDGVLTDQFDHVLEVNDILNDELLKRFGEEEEDMLYVRNNKFMTDYEIVLEHKSSPPTALAEGDEDDD